VFSPDRAATKFEPPGSEHPYAVGWDIDLTRGRVLLGFTRKTSYIKRKFTIFRKAVAIFIHLLVFFHTARFIMASPHFIPVGRVFNRSPMPRIIGVP